MADGGGEARNHPNAFEAPGMYAEWAAFEERVLVDWWVAWRASYPVRAAGGVILTESALPMPPGNQSPWHHYVQRSERDGRVLQEWWMAPFLVPFDETVGWVPGGTGSELLGMVGPASGGRPTTRQEHYTNVHRITCLARCHPLVVLALPHRNRPSWAPELSDAEGRAAPHHHQSPYDLRLVLGPGAIIVVECSVRNARRDLLSLSWYPACNMTAEMESLARAVFFDLVEAAHEVPTMYASGFRFRAAPGAWQAAPPEVARRDEGEAPPTCPRGSSSSMPFLGADAPVASSRAAPSTAAPSTSSAARSASAAALPAAAPAAASAAPAAAAYGSPRVWLPRRHTVPPPPTAHLTCPRAVLAVSGAQCWGCLRGCLWRAVPADSLALGKQRMRQTTPDRGRG